MNLFPRTRGYNILGASNVIFIHSHLFFSWPISFVYSHKMTLDLKTLFFQCWKPQASLVGEVEKKICLQSWRPSSIPSLGKSPSEANSYALSYSWGFTGGTEVKLILIFTGKQIHLISTRRDRYAHSVGETAVNHRCTLHFHFLLSSIHCSWNNGHKSLQWREVHVSVTAPTQGKVLRHNLFSLNI